MKKSKEFKAWMPCTFNDDDEKEPLEYKYIGTFRLNGKYNVVATTKKAAQEIADIFGVGSAVAILWRFVDETKGKKKG